MKRALLLLIVCWLAVPAFGTWAFVQSKEANSTGGTTQAATFDATPTVGNIVIVGFETTNNGGAGVPIITDNQGNAYGAVAWSPFNGAIGAQLYCGIATTSSGTFTVTGTGISEDATIFIREYSGGSCELDQKTSGTGSTSPYGCGSMTTLNANDLLLTLINTNNGGTNTYTTPTGYGNAQSQTSGTHQSGAIADKIASATGTFSPTWTDSATGATGNCVQASLKQASSGGGTTVSGSFVVAN